MVRPDERGQGDSATRPSLELREGWKRVRRNEGAARVEGQTLAEIDRRVRAVLPTILGASLLIACNTGPESDEAGIGLDEIWSSEFEFGRHELTLGVGEVQSLQVSACCSFVTLIDAPEFCEEGVRGSSRIERHHHLDRLAGIRPATRRISGIIPGNRDNGHKAHQHMPEFGNG